MTDRKLRFAVIGLNHPHIYAQVALLLGEGAELVSAYAPEPELLSAFAQKYPQAKVACCEAEILEDPTIQLVTTAGIPCDRAPLGVRVMRHGKDFLSDKPGVTTLEQLEEVRRVIKETGRIYAIYYAERLDNGATVLAVDMIRQGAIGKVVQTMGVGPHRINLSARADWFFQKQKYGGILVDIGSHQVDQFLYFADAKSAEVASAQIANFHYPQYPELEDFGDMTLRTKNCAGYMRLDWFTPDGLPTFGDARLTVIGTDGYMEIRKYIDLEGRPGGNHLFVVDHKGIRYFDGSGIKPPYAAQLINDVFDRTETAMTQDHCLLVAQLTIEAEMKADRLGNLATLKG